MGKREEAVGKSFAKLKEKEERMTVDRLVLEKSQKQAKLDSDSIFQRETKLSQDKKDLGKDWHQNAPREDGSTQRKGKFNEKIRKDAEKDFCDRKRRRRKCKRTPKDCKQSDNLLIVS